ncbi:MAG: hypothetical protein HGA31_04400 [Candidatus Moranbacteria bacterium]|nr:hypothetical protein [Candidatus Moranbacteria bacterium]
MNDKDETRDDAIRIYCARQNQEEYVAVEDRSNIRGTGRSNEESIGDLMRNVVVSLRPEYLNDRRLFIDGYETKDGYAVIETATGIRGSGSGEREALGSLMIALARQKPDLVSIEYR